MGIRRENHLRIPIFLNFLDSELCILLINPSKSNYGGTLLLTQLKFRESELCMLLDNPSVSSYKLIIAQMFY